MKLFTHSPLLQALGYAIINSLWQFAFLWLVFVAANTVIRQSHLKYNAALLLQFSGFAWFAGTFAFYYNQCVQAATHTAITGMDLDFYFQPAQSFKERMYNLLLIAEQMLPFLSVAYLSLLVLFSLKWLQSFKITRQIQQNGLLKIDVQWRLFIKQMSARMGIKKQVHIYISELVKSPITVGFIKPLILLPVACVNNLSAEQTEAILLHELAHIKRNDYLINLLLTIIESLLFFNPFVGLISKQIKRERENSCDDWVLQFQYNAATYALALLNVAKHAAPQVNFAMNAAGKDTPLLNRVKRMIEQQEQKSNYSKQLFALVITTAVLFTLSWVNPWLKGTQTTTASISHPVVAEPIAATIKNPLFNPVFFLAKEDKKATLQIVEVDLPGAALAPAEPPEPITPEPMAPATDAEWRATTIITRALDTGRFYGEQHFYVQPVSHYIYPAPKKEKWSLNEAIALSISKKDIATWKKILEQLEQSKTNLLVTSHTLLALRHHPEKVKAQVEDILSKLKLRVKNQSLLTSKYNDVATTTEVNHWIQPADAALLQSQLLADSSLLLFAFTDDSDVLNQQQIDADAPQNSEGAAYYQTALHGPQPTFSFEFKEHQVSVAPPAAPAPSVKFTNKKNVNIRGLRVTVSENAVLEKDVNVDVDEENIEQTNVRVKVAMPAKKVIKRIKI